MMAKVYPEKLDIDTKLLDIFTESLELLLEAYETHVISSNSFAGGVRDLIVLTRNVPRSVTITVGDENA